MLLCHYLCKGTNSCAWRETKKPKRMCPAPKLFQHTSAMQATRRVVSSSVRVPTLRIPIGCACAHMAVASKCLCCHRVSIQFPGASWPPIEFGLLTGENLQNPGQPPCCFRVLEWALGTCYPPRFRNVVPEIMTSKKSFGSANGTRTASPNTFHA